MKQWVLDEVCGMPLKDKRRNERAAVILTSLIKNPATSILHSCSGDKAKIKGTYRFIENEAIDEQDILEGHYQSTLKRIGETEGTILFASDGMDISLNTLKATKNLGYLSNHAIGINAHNTFAIAENSIPLGMFYQDYWSRRKEEYGKAKLRAKRKFEDKETYYWAKALDKIEGYLPKERDYIFVGDGHADMLDLFCKKRRTNSSLIVHLVHDRKLVGENKHLFEKLDVSQPIGEIVQKLERTKSTPERTVTLEICVEQVTISVSKNRKKSENLLPVKLSAIFVREIKSDVETKNKILWRLLTTESVKGLDGAKKIIDYYTKRWLIERYHYILKEGCRIEKLQLETAKNFERAVALYSIIAFRIMHMTYLARIEPETPCTRVFSKQEWQALWCYHYKKSMPPNEPLTIQHAIFMLAKIGGFMGRKRDGVPGAKVVWRGVMVLEAITQTFLIFNPRCG